MGGLPCESSFDPRDDSDVEDADAAGESPGDPATEFEVVEGVESVPTCRLSALDCGRAVVLMLSVLQADTSRMTFK